MTDVMTAVADEVVNKAVEAVRAHSWTGEDVAEFSDRSLAAIIRVAFRSAERADVTAPVTSAVGLPPLEEPCKDCPTDAERVAVRQEHNEWADKEHAAYVAYLGGPDASGWNKYEAWQLTRQYRELRRREPESYPLVGCVECDETGVRPTAAGRQVLEFVRRWAS